MKQIRIRMVAALLAALLCLPGLTGCIVVNLPGDQSGSTFTTWWDELSGDVTIGSGSVSTDGISRIRIDWVAGDVEIVSGTGSAISIAETASVTLSADEQLRFQVKDGQLCIAYCKSGIRTTSLKGKTLTVTVPEALAASLKELDVEVVSSDVRVSGISGGELELDMVSGNPTVEKGSFGEVDINSVSGSATLRLDAMPDKIDFDSVSGNLHVVLPKEGASFSLTHDTVSGGVKCALPVTVEGKRYIYGDGACKIDCDTVSGGVEITQGG